MQVIIRLSNHTKLSAENQAFKLGYASLAALLKVMATLLADRDTDEVRSNQSKPLKMLGKLPHPDQFTHWPPNVAPTIATTDPELYAFYIQIGIIR